MKSIRLSKFGKGIKESAALSFGLSALSLCDKSCQMLKRGFCYAERPERMYKGYYDKLIRNRRTKPENLINEASLEVDKLNLKWFRFSVSGSLPLSVTGEFKKAFRALCEKLVSRGILIHCPVETYAKAKLYRSILVGLPIVVRRTIQNKRNLFKFKDKAAYVVGEKPGVHNLELANELAKKLRTNKSVVVCPAVFKNKFGEKSKCGKCTACASDKVDLILYPLH